MKEDELIGKTLVALVDNPQSISMKRGGRVLITGRGTCRKVNEKGEIIDKLSWSWNIGAVKEINS
jgi:hypothetical protein